MCRKRVSRRVGFCTACLELKEHLEFHHVVPQRYEVEHKYSEFAWLCHLCHRELHNKWIDPLGRMSRRHFIDATRQFLWKKRN